MWAWCETVLALRLSPPLLPALSFAQVPHAFQNGDVADAEKINENLNYLKEEIDELGRKVTCFATGSVVIGTWRGTHAAGGDYHVLDITLRPAGGLSGQQQLNRH